MVEWLEVPANNKIIKGETTTGKAVAHGTGVTKIEGFGRMAKYVHRASIAHMHEQGHVDDIHLQQWTPLICQSRWNSHFRRYKKTRDRLQCQTGFGVTEAMLAGGVTVEAMVEESCPYFYRIDEVFGEQANVNPVSQTDVPELEEDEHNWAFDNDVSLTGNPEVNPTPAVDVDTLEDPPSTSNDDFNLPSLEYELPPGGTSASSESHPSMTRGHPHVDNAQTAPRSTPNSAPSLVSLTSPEAALRGETKGVDKANNAKRRDFASIYTETSTKRLEFSQKRLKEDIALKKAAIGSRRALSTP
ncbi:hypothetical protein PHMEG_00029050 [Phytophthora megakarya]|uniref:Uncharacterized protein n=1 Tax=Phytophthora megakarya TaxID=4795 RepID=A0A225V3K4_9STRA|nr:hypothetical protein PHMEG_00029050 [Phytophthora megakarya]